MDNILSKTILRDWGGINVVADIDEKIEDIRVAVKYSDHGDDFLFIKTKDGKAYEYGWYIGRRDVFCPDYDRLIESPNNWGFIRKPKLSCAFDAKCSLSNEIYFYVDRTFDNGHHFDIPRIDTPVYAQIKFDGYVRFMDEVYRRGITYHKEKDKDFIERYLKDNNILTEENLNKLHSIRFSSGENGIDGSAGKRERYADKILEGDKIEFVWYNGEILKPNDKQVKYYYDHEYFERFRLYINKFK